MDFAQAGKEADKVVGYRIYKSAEEAQKAAPAQTVKVIKMGNKRADRSHKATSRKISSEKKSYPIETTIKGLEHSTQKNL